MSLSRGKFSSRGIFQSLLEQLSLAYIERLPVAAVTDCVRIVGGVSEKAVTFLPPGFLDQCTHRKVSTRETVFCIPSHVLLGRTKSSAKAKAVTWFCHIVAFALVESIAIFFQVAE